MKAVAIFCTSLQIGQEPLTSDYYWSAYLDLLLALKNRGIKAYFATDNSTYLGGGRFSVAYTTDMKIQAPSQLKAVTDVHVDLVLDRAISDPFGGADVTVINSKQLRSVANDKISVYGRFGKFQPFSRIAHTDAELAECIEDMPSEKVVVKEPTGSGGYEVYIGGKDVIRSQVPKGRFPLLVQEFLDTSAGVPGYGPGVHDVRTGICGGRIISYYIRRAKAGSLHSNVSQGGKMDFLPVSAIPRQLEDIIRLIDSGFGSVPRYYSIDFVHTQKGWKLLELNPYLALLPASDHDEASKTLDELADYLEEVVNGKALGITFDQDTPIEAGIR